MLDFIRGTIRPTLTWLGFIALTIMALYRVLVLGDSIPEWYIAMVAMMIAFWFGQRKPQQ